MALPEASAPGAPLVRARALVEHIGPQGQPDLFAGEALLVPAKVRPQEVSVRVVRVETGRAVVLPTASRLYAIEGSRASVRASFDAGSEGELSATAGQLATILHGSVDDGWLLAAIVDTSDILHAEDTRARIGFLPASYVEIDAPSGMSASAASAKLAPVPPQDLRRAAARAFGEDSGLKARSCARWLIDPRNNPRVAYWDATTASALIFTALITPFEVGFLDPPRSFFEPLFLINLMITLIFAVDCALQFVLLVEVQTPMGYIWVSDMRVIARTYLRSWFTIDVLSIGVSAIDFISLADSDSITTESMSAGLSDLRALRILRALRLIRLMKLLTSARVIKRWEVKVAINYPALSLAKALLGMLLMSHWFACIWGLQASFAPDKTDTWLGGNANLCTSTSSPAGAAAVVTCGGAGAVYMAALYWAVMTITSIGYGDVAATPNNVSEQAVATLLMLLSAIGWGLVLGTIVSNLNRADPDADHFTETMSELNRMMSSEGLPYEMRIRLREYFRETRHVRSTLKRIELLRLMSPALQAEVAYEISSDWLTKVWFLDGTPRAFMVQVSLRLEPRVFAPGESAPIGPLYVVHRGVALYGGIVKGPGAVWGEDVILSIDALKQTWMAKALNFVEVFLITRKSLEEVVHAFPSAKKKLRFRAIRLSVRRGFVREANRRKWESASPDSPPSLNSKSSPSDILASASKLTEEDAGVSFLDTHADRNAIKRFDAAAANGYDSSQLTTSSASCFQRTASMPSTTLTPALTAANHSQQQHSQPAGIFGMFGSGAGAVDASGVASSVVAALLPALDKLQSAQAQLQGEMRQSREGIANLGRQVAGQREDLAALTADVRALVLNQQPMPMPQSRASWSAKHLSSDSFHA